MGKDPQQRGGLVLRGAHLFQFEIVNSGAREAQFQAIFAVVQQSLRPGEGVLFHCICRGSRGGDWPDEAHRGQDASLANWARTTEWGVLAAAADQIFGHVCVPCTWRPGTRSRCVRTSRRGTRPGVSGARSWLRTSMKPSLGSDPSVQRASILLLLPFGSNDPEAYENVVAFALRAL